MYCASKPPEHLFKAMSSEHTNMATPVALLCSFTTYLPFVVLK